MSQTDTTAATVDAEQAAARLRIDTVICMGLHQEIEAMAGVMGVEPNDLAATLIERGMRLFDKVTRWDVDPSKLIDRLARKACDYQDQSTLAWTITTNRSLVIRVRLRAKEEDLTTSQMAAYMLVHGIEDLQEDELPA